MHSIRAARVAQGNGMNLNDAKLAFLDVETTGLFPAMGDRVVEIGIVVCRGDREVELVAKLVNPGRPIPPDAQRVHGIQDRDVADRASTGAWAISACGRTFGQRCLRRSAD